MKVVSRIAGLLSIALCIVLLGCGKKTITSSDITGDWIEITSDSDKVRLSLMQDGTLYTQYVDTSGTAIIDTGYFNLAGEGGGIYFNFSWGSNGGNWTSEYDQITINDFYTDIFPTSTVFNRE